MLLLFMLPLTIVRFTKPLVHTVVIMMMFIIMRSRTQRARDGDIYRPRARARS